MSRSLQAAGPSVVACCLLSALLGPDDCSAQSVLVVDSSGGPGSRFTSLQAAIDAAASGDTILVRPGSYSTPVAPAVRNKSLAIVGDRPGTVQVNRLIIDGLGPTGAVLVQGLSLRQVRPGTLEALVVSRCQGSIRVEDCSIVSVGDPSSITAAGVLVGAASASFHRCTISGGSRPFLTPALQPGSPGLIAADSQVFVFDCTVIGGSSSPGVSATGTLDGAAGLHARGESFAHLQRCTVTGGNGSQAAASYFGQCVPGGNGGPGIRASGSSSVDMLESTGIGGNGGAGSPQLGCPGGTKGPPTVGSVTTIGDLGHSVSALSPVREGQPVAFTLTGPQGDLAVLLLSARQGTALLPSFGSPLLVGPPLLGAVPAGIWPSSGTIQLTFPGVALPPAVNVVILYTQVAALRAVGGGVSFGSGQALVVLDASI